MTAFYGIAEIMSGFLFDLLNRIDGVEPDWNSILLEKKGLTLVGFVNPHSVFVAKRHEDYVRNLFKHNYLFSDGVLLAKLSEFITGRAVRRISFDGNSIATDVLMLCATLKRRVAIIGGKEGVAQAAGEVFQSKYGLDVRVCRNGYFKDSTQMLEFATELRRLGVEVVICGMGAPYQERFMCLLREADWVGTAFSCGGYLDQVISSGVKYYPDWVERYNLRAIYRLTREPRRLGRRYFLEYLPFFSTGLLLIVRKFVGRSAV